MINYEETEIFSPKALLLPYHSDWLSVIYSTKPKTQVPAFIPNAKASGEALAFKTMEEG